MSSKNHVEKYKSCGYILCYAPWHKKANKHGYVSNLEILSKREHNRLHGIEIAWKRGFTLQDRSPCPICGQPKWPGTKTCASCSSKINRILRSLQSKLDNSNNHTSAQELLYSLLKSKTIAQVASMFGVSTTTICRAIRKLEISYASKRHLNKGNINNLTNPQSREKCKLAVKEYHKTHRNSTAIPIGSYDSEGNLVKTYAAISDVAKDGFSSTCVLRVVNGERKSHKKLLWRKLAM